MPQALGIKRKRVAAPHRRSLADGRVCESAVALSPRDDLFLHSRKQAASNRFQAAYLAVPGASHAKKGPTPNFPNFDVNSRT